MPTYPMQQTKRKPRTATTPTRSTTISPNYWDRARKQRITQQQPGFLRQTFDVNTRGLADGMNSLGRTMMQMAGVPLREIGGAGATPPVGPMGNSPNQMLPYQERRISRFLDVEQMDDPGLEMARRESGAGRRIVRQGGAAGPMVIHPMAPNAGFPLAPQDQPRQQEPPMMARARAAANLLRSNPELEVGESGVIGPSTLVGLQRPGESSKRLVNRLRQSGMLQPRTFRREGGLAYQEGDSPRLRAERAQELIAQGQRQFGAQQDGQQVAAGGFGGAAGIGPQVAQAVEGRQTPMDMRNQLRIANAMQRRQERQQRLAQRNQPQQGPNPMQMMAMRAMQFDPSMAPALMSAMSQSQLGQAQLGIARQGLENQMALGQQDIGLRSRLGQQEHERGQQHNTLFGQNLAAQREQQGLNFQQQLEGMRQQFELGKRELDLRIQELQNSGDLMDRGRASMIDKAVERGEMTVEEGMEALGGGPVAGGGARGEQSRYGMTGLTTRDAEYVESVKGTATGPEDLRNWARSRGMSEEETEKFLNDVYGSVFRTADDPYGNWEWWKHGGPLSPFNFPQFGGGRLSKGMSNWRKKTLGY